MQHAGAESLLALLYSGQNPTFFKGRYHLPSMLNPGASFVSILEGKLS